MKKNFARIALALLVMTVLVGSIFALAACNDKNAAQEDKPLAFGEDRTFYLDITNTNFMGNKLAQPVMMLLLDEQKTCFTFKADGTVHGQLTLKEGLLSLVDSLLPLAGSMFPDMDLNKDTIGEMISSVDLSDGLESYAEPMFPGFTKCLEDGDATAAFKLIQDSLGLNISGINFGAEPLKGAVKTMGEGYKNTGKLTLPANLLDLLPKEGQIALTADWQYDLVHLTSSDNYAYDAIYIGGPVAHRPSTTQPFAIFTMGSDAEGNATMKLRIDFMNIDLALTQKAPAQA